MAIGYILYSFHLPYRQTDIEEIIKATGEKNLPEKMHIYGHVCRKINKLDVYITNNKTDHDVDKYIII